MAIPVILVHGKLESSYAVPFVFNGGKLEECKDPECGTCHVCQHQHQTSHHEHIMEEQRSHPHGHIGGHVDRYEGE